MSENKYRGDQFVLCLEAGLPLSVYATIFLRATASYFYLSAMYCKYMDTKKALKPSGLVKMFDAVSEHVLFETITRYDMAVVQKILTEPRLMPTVYQQVVVRDTLNVFISKINDV